MYRLILVFIFVSQSSLSALSQVPSADSQTIQTVLKEVRQLRQDFKTATIAIERAQILIHRLHEEGIALGMALQRLDAARAKLTVAQTSRETLAMRIKNIEDQQSDMIDPVGSKETGDLVSQLKAKLTISLAEEQEAHTRVTDAEAQVQAEEAKSGALQDQLDQLDKALNNSMTR